MSSIHALENKAAEARLMKEALLREYPSLAEDAQALADNLEGVTDIDAAIGAVVEGIAENESLAKGAKERARELQARAARFEKASDSMRAALLAVMKAVGRAKITLPEATVSLRALSQRAIVADDAAAVAAGYGASEEKTVYIVDSAAITKALKDGATLPFASLSEAGSSIAIRRG